MQLHLAECGIALTPFEKFVYGVWGKKAFTLSFVFVNEFAVFCFNQNIEILLFNDFDEMNNGIPA